MSGVGFQVSGKKSKKTETSVFVIWNFYSSNTQVTLNPLLSDSLLCISRCFAVHSEHHPQPVIYFLYVFRHIPAAIVEYTVVGTKHG